MVCLNESFFYATLKKTNADARKAKQHEAETSHERIDRLEREIVSFMEEVVAVLFFLKRDQTLHNNIAGVDRYFKALDRRLEDFKESLLVPLADQDEKAKQPQVNPLDDDCIRRGFAI